MKNYPVLPEVVGGKCSYEEFVILSAEECFCPNEEGRLYDRIAAISV